MKISPEEYAAGKRGPSTSTLGTIKQQSKIADGMVPDLRLSIDKVREEIKKADEENAINLCQENRKFFGYIQFCNIAKEVNIALFTEGSLRWYHESCKRDYIFTDATGGLFSKISGYKRLLFYTLVVRHPFPGNPPIPVAEYITSSHTADSFGMFLSTLRQAEKDVYGVKGVSKPRGIVCDFSFPIIEGILQEFNKQSLREFLDLTFDIVNDDGEAPDLAFPRLIAAHMMNLNRKWGLKLSQQHSRSSSAVHLAMRLFGRLIQCETIQDMNEIVHTATLVFCYRYNTLELKNHLAKLEKNINTFKPSSLLNDISDGKKEYPSVEDDSDDMITIEDSGSAKSETTKATNVKENSEILYQIKGSKFQKYWDKKIFNLQQQSKGEAVGVTRNKYFFPEYIEHIRKLYLPVCILWSKIVFSEVVNSFCTNRFSKLDCRALKDGADTNTQAEEFFRIKKNTTFKEKRRDRINSFIKENYEDNLGLQRQFADGILSGIKDKRKTASLKGMKFVAEQLSQANAGISDDDKVDTSDNGSDDDFIAQSTERWEKGVKRKPNSTIKGTYVSPPKKPLFINPFQNAKNADDLPRKDKKHLFQSFKKDMWSKLPKEMKGYHTRNRTIKSL